MKFKALTFLFSLMLLMCGPAWAQDGEVTLDHVDGLYHPDLSPATDTVNTGSVITFHIRMNNNTGWNLKGNTNGFEIYSPSGAEWTTITGLWTGTITTAMYDIPPSTNIFSDDGMGADTIGFGGFKFFAPGVPAGFNEIVWTIDIGPIDASHHKGEICIDSAFYRPGGTWKWSTSDPDVEPRYPTWDGPHCFTIWDSTNVGGNEVPVLAAIGAQSTDEGVQLTFDVSATDADSDPLTLRLNGDLPLAADFTDNGDGTGAFDWTPTFDDAGVYTAQIVADDGTDTTFEDVTITVTNVPQPPVLNAIGDKTVAECQNLGFTMSATDPEGGTAVFTMIDEDVPVAATLTDHGDNTATFSWTTVGGDAGVYTATFVATVGALADSEVVAITVTANAAPVITPIADQSFGECGLLTFTVTATDPEGGPLTLSSGALPGAATFTAATGVFEWAAVAGDATGSPYAVDFFADDNCGNQDNITVNITVTANQPPVLTAVPDQDVAECDVVSFTVEATDPDGGAVVLSSDALPGTATFDAGTGAFAWTTVAGDAGAYSVDFYATDPCDLADTITVNINIAADQAPVLTAVPDQNVTECETVSFTVEATDPDLTTPVLSMGTAPGLATFDPATGAFEWTTIVTDVGNYTVDFYATDACGLADTITVNIFVAANQAPVVSFGAASYPATECVELTIPFNAADPEGTTLTFEIVDMEPGEIVFVDNGDGTGTFTGTPPEGSAGTEVFLFVATDECGLADTTSLDIIIAASAAPVIATIDDFSTAECTAINLGVVATDAELGTIVLTTLPLPEGAAFVDNADGSGTFTWDPVFGDAVASPYAVTFIADDDCGKADTMIVNITIDPDGAPTFAADEASYNFTECVEDTVTFTYSDPEGTTLTFAMIDMEPGEIVFTDNGDGTGFFVGTPPSGSAGTDTLVVVATDECGSADTVGVEMIIAADELPVFDPVDPQELQAGQEVTVVLNVTDPEDGTITMWFDTTDLPDDGSLFTFTDSGNGVATFVWETNLLTQVQSYEVSFYAGDGCGETELIVTFDVITGVAPNDGAELPDQFYLTQNFPNPFNPVTQIEFGIPEKSHVTLAVYNVLGQRIRTLVDETLPANNYTAEWNGNSDLGVRVASGIYFYKLETSMYTETKKMILLK